MVAEKIGTSTNCLLDLSGLMNFVQGLWGCSNCCYESQRARAIEPGGAQT